MSEGKRSSSYSRANGDRQRLFHLMMDEVKIRWTVSKVSRLAGVSEELLERWLKDSYLTEVAPFAFLGMSQSPTLVCISG
eukprot:1327560-Amorphochlora_amoeboformis.AAC.2